MSLQSKRPILRQMENGNLLIDPFNAENVKTASYDVTLGEWFYAPQENPGGRKIFNPYSEADVRRVWGKPIRAPLLRDWLLEQLAKDPNCGVEGLEGIDPDTRVIMIPPGEMYLCHTEEFIGGLLCINTSMHARSGVARSFLTVCKCAGWGDVGYINRWTMEVNNTSKHYWIPLPVGYRFAQIAFHEVEPVDEDYGDSGKYQLGHDLKTLKQGWTPDLMLPRMWKDREAAAADWQKLMRELQMKRNPDEPLKMRRYGIAPQRGADLDDESGGWR